MTHVNVWEDDLTEQVYLQWGDRGNIYRMGPLGEVNVSARLPMGLTPVNGNVDWEEAFNTGYAEGYDEGESGAYEAGYEDGRASMEDEF